MKTLAVDTALGACSAAVLDGDVVCAHALQTMERGHAEALAPMVKSAMDAAKLTFAELDRLAVTTGPGTFTGQRVGLAFMRGLRVALKLPLAGITTLQAMASAAMEKAGTPFGAALHDAKRGEVYAGLYSRDTALLEPVLLSFEDAVASIRERMQSYDHPLAFAGTAGAVAAETYRRLGGEAVVSSIVHPDALWVAKLAQRAPTPADAPRPLYLRPPDARLPARPA
jgi:tRNA threonylcarbamoyladenosine biosynthesis protein TsaB